MRKLSLKNTINNYLSLHKFTKEEFCRITNYDLEILNKILNHELYVSIFDLKKLAYLMDFDFPEILF